MYKIKNNARHKIVCDVVTIRILNFSTFRNKISEEYFTSSNNNKYHIINTY